ncbi:MAG: hypothetical protein NT007_13225 [Candidatus Kapabacteria bacterium]|nr:hypothetical protein [Candidatus Kapabacteria bacterium]
MKIKIALPNSKLYEPFYSRFDELKLEFPIEIYILPEARISELMLANRLDCALMTPWSYGQGVINADYRIIPGPALSSYSYTQIGTLFFNRNLKDIKSLATINPDDFLSKIAALILAETYGQYPAIIKVKGSPDELVKLADCAFSYENGAPDDVTLDISEEWYMSYEYPLPLAFWVIRNEEPPEEIVQIVHQLFRKDQPKEVEIIEEELVADDVEPRVGKLKWYFDDEFKEALETTLEFLFLQQLIPELAAVKVLGEYDESLLSPEIT